MNTKDTYSYRFVKTDTTDYGECSFSFSSRAGLEHSISHSLIKPGMYFSLYNMPAGSTWDIDFQIDSAPVTFSFSVQGKSLTTYKRRGHLADESICTSPGKALVANLAHTKGTFQIDKNLPYRNIGIAIDPDLLLSYISPYAKTIPSELTKYLRGDICGAFFLPMHPKMEKTIFEISCRNAFTHPETLFLESKILELLSYQIEALIYLGKRERKSTLSDEDIQRIYGARDILLANIKEYQGIVKLARRLGINDFKLKKGFRELFGTTVFAYVTKERMKTAQKAIHDGGKSVSKIAYHVGYTNTSHFIAAYRKEFGITPGKYIKRLYG